MSVFSYTVREATIENNTQYEINGISFCLDTVKKVRTISLFGFKFNISSWKETRPRSLTEGYNLTLEKIGPSWATPMECLTVKKNNEPEVKFFRSMKQEDFSNFEQRKKLLSDDYYIVVFGKGFWRKA